MDNADFKLPKRLAITLLFCVSMAVTSLLLSNSLWISINMVGASNFPTNVVTAEIPANTSVIENDEKSQQSHCALLFFGLPRAFESLTMPSLLKNVLPYNKDCHVYVHFYHKEREAAGRSGRGGDMNADEIYLLQQHVEKAYFVAETESQFWEKRRDVLHKIRTTKDENGNLLYIPWKEKTFSKDSATNIIKMWHSIESVWNLAEEQARKEGIRYDNIAVLRSDVMYVTPLRLNEHATSNSVVVPGFAKFPVNDRMIYGPYEGVKIWAAERFSRIDEHVRTNEEGYGIHDERFLQRTIFPAIQKALQNDSAIVDHPTLCFLRARVDQSVWLNDCDRNVLPSVRRSIGNVNKLVVLIEKSLGRSCEGPPKKYNKFVTYLNCSRQ